MARKFIKEDNAERIYNMLSTRLHRKLHNLYLFSGNSQMESDTIEKTQIDMNNLLDVLNAIAQDYFTGSLTKVTALKLYQEDSGEFYYEIMDYDIEIKLSFM